MQRIVEHGRCAACGRVAPAAPSVVASVAGLTVGYLCADCPPWDADETFRAFDAEVRERYAGLPIRFAFWPQWAASPGDRHADGAASLLAKQGRYDAR